MIPPTCISHWFTYLLCNYVVPVEVESTTENTNGYEDSDWLHRNNSYERHDGRYWRSHTK